jgi:hypothetical protein
VYVSTLCECVVHKYVKNSRHTDSIWLLQFGMHKKGIVIAYVQ